LCNTFNICTKTKALIGKGFHCANILFLIAAHVPPPKGHMIGNQRSATKELPKCKAILEGTGQHVEGTMIVGYARVSTDGQTLDAQRHSLKAAGAERTFAEKVSGAKTDRRELAKAIEALGIGDVLLVTRLDRLARSTRDLLNLLATIADKSAGFKSLADAWADTTTPHGRLMLTVLGGLAEFERELIRARTDERRKRAQARGVQFGRKLKLTPHQVVEALRRREAGEALVEIGRSYNVSHSTISRL
jgi:DNA invertase Pin-like site-specific DNA recombinase